MKILVISQHFWPENFLINDITDRLQKSGFEVIVLTANPNYPKGKIYTGYSNIRVHKTIRPSGVKIFHLPIFPRKDARAIFLILNYISFVLSCSILGTYLLRNIKIECIFVNATSPIFQALPGLLFRLIKKAPVMIWVQDLWPDVLRATGHIKRKFILNLIDVLVRFLYSRADLLLAQSQAFVDAIATKVPRKIVKYQPNPSFSIEGCDRCSRADAAGDTVFLFAGNLGKAQALDTILDAAELLKDYHDIKFLLVGSGSEEVRLHEEIQRRELNVEMPGSFPSEEMATFYKDSSALILCLSGDEVISKTIPSKLQTYMSVGKPIIMSCNGESARILKDADAGLCSPAQDSTALVKNILFFRSLDRATREKYGENARLYHDRHFDPDKLTRQLAEHITFSVGLFKGDGN